MSNRSQVIATLTQLIAFPSGLIAAILSQVSSPNYHLLFVIVAGLTLLCLISSAVSVIALEGRERYMPLPAAALAVAGCIEFGARLLGVRLLD